MNYNQRIANRLKKNNIDMICHLEEEDHFPIKTAVELRGGVRQLKYLQPTINQYEYPATLSTGLLPDRKMSSVYFNDAKNYGAGFFDDLVNVGRKAGDVYSGALSSQLLGLGRRRGRPRSNANPYGGKTLPLDGAGFWDDLRGVGSKIGSTVVNKLGDAAVRKGEEYLTNKLSGKGRPRSNANPYGGKTLPLDGAGFWDDLRGVGSKIGSTVVNKLGDAAVRKGEEYLTNKLSGKGRRSNANPYGGKSLPLDGGFINPFEMGYDLGHDVIGPAIFGRGRRKAKPSTSTGAKSRRGQMVSKLMREKGMSLGQASKYIKEHNLM
jgi:hypothetical protein